MAGFNYGRFRLLEKKDETSGLTLRLGLVNVTGNSREELNLKVNLPKQPQGVLINAHYDVLSRID